MVTEAGFITIPTYIENLVVKKMALYYFQPDGFVVKGTKNECGLDQNLNKIKRFTENHNGFYFRHYGQFHNIFGQVCSINPKPDSFHC